ncbi:hypothetical protein [Burkholderia pseudomultivorans]|uniref:hypothetical protein n=1 Tax=Burkholderia pseudomultivorans TaxID=1207504 RepID=UPI000B155B85|nr:hypothetical protein [Burkholderia pseudomultivorans]
MFGESSSAKSRRFPWINLAFYRGCGGLCKKAAGPAATRVSLNRRGLLSGRRKRIEISG